MDKSRQRRWRRQQQQQAAQPYGAVVAVLHCGKQMMLISRVSFFDVSDMAQMGSFSRSSLGGGIIIRGDPEHKATNPSHSPEISRLSAEIYPGFVDVVEACG